MAMTKFCIDLNHSIFNVYTFRKDLFKHLFLCNTISIYNNSKINKYMNIFNNFLKFFKVLIIWLFNGSSSHLITKLSKACFIQVQLFKYQSFTYYQACMHKCQDSIYNLLCIYVTLTAFYMQGLTILFFNLVKSILKFYSLSFCFQRF